MKKKTIVAKKASKKIVKKTKNLKAIIKTKDCEICLTDFFADFFKKYNLITLLEEKMILELIAKGASKEAAKAIVSKLDIDLGVVEGNISILED